MNFLTRSEELILLAVWKLQDEAYGAAIRRYLTEVSGQEWLIGAVYIPLDRLARKGYVRSYLGAATRKRGGRSKRFFQLTPAGLAALQNVRRVQEILWQGLPPLSFEDAR